MSKSNELLPHAFYSPDRHVMSVCFLALQKLHTCKKYSLDFQIFANTNVCFKELEESVYRDDIKAL